MYVDDNLLSIAFRLSLFGLFIYKTIELIRQYVLPFLYKRVLEIKNEHMELIEKEKYVKSTLKRMQQQVSYQKKMFSVLEKKVESWHRLMQKRRLDAEKEMREAEQRMRDRRRQQAKLVKIDTLSQAALPRAIYLAEEDFIKNYRGEAGVKLLKKIIAQLPHSGEFR